FKFTVWSGQDMVAAVSKVSALKRTTEVVSHRHGGDNTTPVLSPGNSKFEPVTLERGVTFAREFEVWAKNVFDVDGPGGMSLLNYKRDLTIKLQNLAGDDVLVYTVKRCWVSEYVALPELDANGNGAAFEHVILQNEGFVRDVSVKEKKET
ncbi:MAG: phage tail protein, partial [Bradyrhizobium icense]